MGRICDSKNKKISIKNIVTILRKDILKRASLTFPYGTKLVELMPKPSTPGPQLE